MPEKYSLPALLKRDGDELFDELVARDKASLDIFWLKDEPLEASDNLPDPDIIALLRP